MDHLEDEKKKKNQDNQPLQASNQQPLSSVEDIPLESIPSTKPEKTLRKRVIKSGTICFGIFLAAVIFFGNFIAPGDVNTSADAQEALKTHTSSTLPVGVRIMSKDDNYVGGDVTITHQSADPETQIQVWDYAAVDGDYVQVKVNGTPLGEPFMITHEPVTLTVPTVGKVEVVGVRDGGGGITYAVRYGMNGMTYFNGMDEGKSNTYTLVKE